MRMFFSLFVCVAVVGVQGYAQTPGGAPMIFGVGADSSSSGAAAPMTLRECMAYAVSNSTQMRIRQAEVGDAQIARRDALLALFTPQVDAQTYAYYNFGRSIDPQTNTYFNTTSFHNNYGVSAGFNLFDGFNAVNNLRISKTGLMISESQQKRAEADICLAVMEAYYNVLYYKRLTLIYQKQVATAERQLALGRRQEELGQKGHADVVQLEADLANRQYDLTNTQNMYQQQRMTLADLMFWPLCAELEIDTALPLRPAESMGADQVLDYALRHSPDVLVAEGKMENARRELNTARWQLLPTVGLYAGWSSSYFAYRGSEAAPFRDQFGNNGGEYVQVSVSIPLWNRMEGHSRVERRRNACQRAAAEYEQKRRDVESEVRRAVQDMEGSAAAYQLARRKAAVQREAYDLNQRKLEQGLISPLEFQMANENYLRAKADEMNSHYRFLIKQAVVKYYSGIDYINQ